MSFELVIVSTVIYAYVSFEQFWLGNWPIGLMYFGYTIGNVGIMGTLK
jgi:hypothetical protein